MKKRQIKKLSLQRTRISDLAQNASKGGVNLSVGAACPTGQATICFTACYGDRDCQFYQTDRDCTITRGVC